MRVCACECVFVLEEGVCEIQRAISHLPRRGTASAFWGAPAGADALELEQSARSQRVNLFAGEWGGALASRLPGAAARRRQLSGRRGSARAPSPAGGTFEEIAARAVTCEAIVVVTIVTVGVISRGGFLSEFWPPFYSVKV